MTFTASSANRRSTYLSNIQAPRRRKKTLMRRGAMSLKQRRPMSRHDYSHLATGRAMTTAAAMEANATAPCCSDGAFIAGMQQHKGSVNQSHCTPNTDTPPSVTKMPARRTRSLGARFQTIAPTTAMARPIYFKGVLPSMSRNSVSSLIASGQAYRAVLPARPRLPEHSSSADNPSWQAVSSAQAGRHRVSASGPQHPD